MSILEAIILGIVQGLTEFLPVSSSGHIELGKAVLGVEIDNDLAFTIVLHGATALSTIVVFRNEILLLFKDLFKIEWNESTQYAAKIIISMVPVGIVGVLFEDVIEGFFEGKILLVGCMLFITGSLLFLTRLQKKNTGEINFLHAFIIGISQAIAILPGISRSGATIGTGLLLGIRKEKMAQFSFLMVLAPILGATLLKYKDFLESSAPASEMNNSALVLVAGFVAAFVSGIVACRWMIRLVNAGKMKYFAFYCFVIGAFAIISTFV